MDDASVRPPNSVDTTSKNLLRRVRENDQAAWSHLVVLYGPIVEFWIRRCGIPANDVADVFQEVFVSVATNIDRFESRGRPGQFRAWLKTIGHNKVMDHFRRKETSLEPHTGSRLFSKHLQIDCSDDLKDAADNEDIVPIENAALVQGAIQLIKQEFREQTWQCFWLTAVEGEEAVEVAQHLGLSPEAVRKNKSRVIARLREALQKIFD